MMLVAKIVLALLIAPVVGEKACPTREEGLVADDATSLLQSHLDVKQGASQSMKIDVKQGASQSTKALADKNADPSTVKKEALVEEETVAISMITKGLAEFVAMTLFVFIGCGTAMSVANPDGHPSEWTFHVSLTFGFAITALAYSIGHYSGGQINCAVTFGLWIAGHITIKQALVNFGFQLLGAIFGSFLTALVFSPAADRTGGLGTNAINRAGGFAVPQAIVGEFMGTFILVFVVLETAISAATAANRVTACLAIGIAVFLAHSVLIPVDGCSINPTRSFGPMLVRMIVRNEKGATDFINDHWVFWVGPLLGAAAAAGVFKVLG